MFNSLKERFLKPKIRAEKSSDEIDQTNTTRTADSSEPELRRSTRGTDNVILHIGLPKTGTTTLQFWARDNDNALAAEGIFVFPLQKCHRLAVECITDEDRLNISDIPPLKSIPFETARNTLIDGASSPAIHTTVVSSEYFSITDPSRVAEIFSEIGVNISRIICFIRRQDDFVVSGYNQSVKGTGNSDILSLPKNYLPMFDWIAMKATWQRVFPKADIVLHNFDHHRENGTLIEVFSRDIGASSTHTLPKTKTTNDSLCAELLEIVRVANAIGLPEIARLAIAAQEGGLTGTPFGPAESERQSMLANYRDSNARLAAENPSDEFADFARGADSRPGINLTGSFPVEFALKLMAWQMKK